MSDSNDPHMPTMAHYLDAHSEVKHLYEYFRHYICGLGDVEVSQTKAQASFGSSRKFAWAWLPQLWIANAPKEGLVISFRLDHPVEHPVIKECLEPSPGNWMHHVEVANPSDLDENLRGWLRQAYELALK